MAHRLESCHKTKVLATKFAAKLKRMGAKEVRIRHTKEGWLVSSRDPQSIW
jgi:hypothetical protein